MSLPNRSTWSGTKVAKLPWPGDILTHCGIFWLRRYLPSQTWVIINSSRTLSYIKSPWHLDTSYFGLVRDPLTVWSWLQVSNYKSWVKYSGICLPVSLSNYSLSGWKQIQNGISKEQNTLIPKDSSLGCILQNWKFYWVSTHDPKIFNLPMLYSLAPILTGRWGKLACQWVAKLQCRFTVVLVMTETKEVGWNSLCTIF